MPFDAFVSYSHAADGRLAPALHRGMQRLAKPWYRVRALRVFSDENVLTANPHLWSSIQAALDGSGWFVLLASPDATASEWVRREIDHWLATQSPDRILVVLTDGTLEWDAEAHRLTGSAVPHALQGAFWDEPRHVDMRWARSETDLDLRNSRFRDAVAQLAAPMHGVAKDELESEDVYLHRRARRLARAATSLLVLLLILALVTGTIAFQQRSRAQDEAARARRERDIAQHDETLTLAGDLSAESLDALRSGRNDVALLLAVEAERTQPSVTAQSTLLSALTDQPMLVRELHGLTQTTTHVVFSPDSRLLAASDGSQLNIWNLRTGRVVATRANLDAAEFTDSSRLLVGTDASGLEVVDVETGRTLRTLPTKDTVWTADASMPIIAAVDPDGTIHVWNARSGSGVGTVTTGRTLGNLVPTSGVAVAISPDATTVALVWRPNAVVNGFIANTTTENEEAWNVASGRALAHSCASSTSDTVVDDVVLSATVLSDDRSIHSIRASEVSPNAGSAFVATCDTSTGTTTTRTLSSTLAGNASFAVVGVSADERLLAARDGLTIQVVDAGRGGPIGNPVRAPYDPGLLQAGTVAFSPDGRYFAGTEYNGDVRLWSTAPQSVLERDIALGSAPPRAISSNGRQIAVMPNGDVVDEKTRATLTRLPNYVPLIGNSVGLENPTLLALSADGRFLSALAYRGTYTSEHSLGFAGENLTVVDLDQRTSHTLQDSTGCQGGLLPTAVSDRLFVVTGCTPEDPSCACIHFSLHTVDISSWPWHQEPPLPVGDRAALQFSPDGKVLAAFVAGGFQLFDVDASGLHPRASTPAPGGCFTFGGVCMGQARSLGSTSEWTGVFTPDSRTLVVDQGTGLIRLVPTDPRGGPGTPLSLADAASTCAGSRCADAGTLGITTDGRELVRATQAGVTLWDIPSRQLIGVIPLAADLSRAGIITSLTPSALTIDDRTGDGIAIDLDPESWARDACAIANRNLTLAEWSEYVGNLPYQRQCPESH